MSARPKNDKEPVWGKSFHGKKKKKAWDHSSKFQVNCQNVKAGNVAAA